MKNIALIVAGGQSVRMGDKIPKPYIEINDKTILEHCLDKFISHSAIDGVMVVIRPEHQSLYEKATANYQLLPHCYGGELRQDSVRNGLNALREYNPQLVLIHDAARIFPPVSLIDELVVAAKTYPSVAPAVKVVDSLQRADQQLVALGAVNREELYAIQTPQVFNYSTILHIHNQRHQKIYSDDITMAQEYGEVVKLVLSNEMNFKITTTEDLLYARYLINHLNA